MDIKTTFKGNYWPLSWFTSMLVAITFFHIGRALYRLYFHPLSKFPGPKLRAISHLPKTYNLFRGVEFASVKDLHDKYGGVVRVAPNELIYASLQASKDIYGFVQGRKQVPKDPVLYNPFYNPVRNIIDANDEEHVRIRRTIAHAFSAQALLEQEPIIVSYFELLVEKLAAYITSPGGIGKVDMLVYYNATLFDMIGDLTFSESFGALENHGHHDYIDTVVDSNRVYYCIIALGSYPFISTPLRLAIRYIPLFETMRNKFENFARERVQRRVDHAQSDRKDFYGAIQKHNVSKRGLSFDELARTSNVIITGGSESTATALAGATYLLLTHPNCMQKLVDEVRTAFPSEEKPTIKMSLQLPYVHAVLEETLRLYPPNSFPLPRKTGFDTEIDGELIPAGIKVSSLQYSLHRSALNFRDPDKFVPERWLGAPEYKDDKLDVVNPFSLGPRNCVGRNIAYANMSCTMAHVFQRFDMSLCEESQNWMDQKEFMMWQKPPLMVEIREREAKT